MNHRERELVAHAVASAIDKTAEIHTPSKEDILGIALTALAGGALGAGAGYGVRHLLRRGAAQSAFGSGSRWARHLPAYSGVASGVVAGGGMYANSKRREAVRDILQRRSA